MTHLQEREKEVKDPRTETANPNGGKPDTVAVGREPAAIAIDLFDGKEKKRKEENDGRELPPAQGNIRVSVISDPNGPLLSPNKSTLQGERVASSTPQEIENVQRHMSEVERLTKSIDGIVKPFVSSVAEYSGLLARAQGVSNSAAELANHKPSATSTQGNSQEQDSYRFGELKLASEKLLSVHSGDQTADKAPSKDLSQRSTEVLGNIEDLSKLLSAVETNLAAESLFRTNFYAVQILDSIRAFKRDLANVEIQAREIFRKGRDEARNRAAA